MNRHETRSDKVVDMLGQADPAEDASLTSAESDKILEMALARRPEGGHTERAAKWSLPAGLVAASLAGAATLLVALSILAGSDAVPRDAGFRSLAASAASADDPRFERVVVSETTREEDSARKVTIWTSDEFRYEVHPATGSQVLFHLPSNTVCDSRSGRAPSCERVDGRIGVDGNRIDASSLSTDPAALRTDLERLVREAIDAGIVRVPLSTSPTEATVIDPNVSWTALDEGKRQDLLDDGVLARAAWLLSDPASGADLRAALFDLLADTPGVDLQDGQADRSGRDSVLVSMRAASASDGSEYRLYLDRETSEVHQLDRVEPADANEPTSVVNSQLFVERASAGGLPGAGAELRDALQAQLSN